MKSSEEKKSEEGFTPQTPAQEVMRKESQLDLVRRFGSQEKEFLNLFPSTVFVYFDDFDASSKQAKDFEPKEGEPIRSRLPVIHSDTLDLDRNALGYGIFFSVNGIRREASRSLRREKGDINVLNALFVDFDSGKFKSEKNDDFSIRTYKQTVLDELEALEFPPVVTIQTKNGVHAYWIFSRPIRLDSLEPQKADEMRIRWERLEQKLVNEVFVHLGADSQAKELNRVLRVPGTYHLKDPRDPYLVKIQSFDLSRCHPFEEFELAFLNTEKPASALDDWANTFQDSLSKTVLEEVEKIFPLLNRPSYQKLLDRDAGPKQGSRNHSLLVAASACRRSAWPLEKTLAYFSRYNGLPLPEIERTIRAAYKPSEPYSFGYNCPALAPVVSEDERAEYQKAVTVAFRRAAISTEPVASPAQMEHEKLLEKALDKEEQKSRYSIFEFIFQRRHPYLKYELGGKFFEFEDGQYVPREHDEIDNLMMQELLVDGLLNFRTRSKVADKLACFRSLPEVGFTPKQADPNPNILNVANGLLDIETLELSPHTPEYISLSKVAFPFNKDAACPRFNLFMQEITLSDKALELVLQKIMGYCLTFDISFHKAFILLGSGRNGKGVFTSVLSELIGLPFVSNLGMREISSNFGLANIYRKKLNIIDEVSSGYFESDIIKKLVSGERIMADVKYREPLTFHPTAKFIFTVNELPRINDQSVGFYERFLVLPFKAAFRNNPDRELFSKLKLEASGILNYAIEGLKLLRAENGFGKTKEMTDAAEEFRVSNSSLLEYISVCLVPDPSSSIRMRDFIQKYKEFCSDFGYKPKSLRSVLKELQFIHETNPELTISEFDINTIKGLAWKPTVLI